MRALVLKAPRTLAVLDVPEIRPGPRQVLVRVSKCGICGSDIRYFFGENPWAKQTLGKEIPNPPNIILGQGVGKTVEHAGQLLDARGWTRLIVDATKVTSRLPTMDLYQCASQSLQRLPKGVRIALVIGAAHATDGRFMEDVARNRSLPLTVFVDAFDARAWLEKECPE